MIYTFARPGDVWGAFVSFCFKGKSIVLITVSAADRQLGTNKRS